MNLLLIPPLESHENPQILIHGKGIQHTSVQEEAGDIV